MRNKATIRCTMTTPIGEIIITTATDTVSHIAFVDVAKRMVFSPVQSRITPLTDTPGSTIAEQVVGQLERYFDNPQWQFDLKFTLAGTCFQQKVWSSLQKTHAGQTLSYGALARRIHSGARAVGSACGRNPLPIIVPCHRVIAADGSLGGFCRDTKGEFMLNKKRWLLAHEANTP